MNIKKNINSIMIAVIMLCVVAVSIFMFSGGARGKSAYQLACENGFKGTQSQWLESLKGTNGKDAQTLDYYALYSSAKANGDIDGNTSYLQFIQSYIANNSQSAENSLLYAIQNSIRSSVSIFVDPSSGYVSAGAGTIIDIDEKGNALIVTNYHVTYTSATNKDIYVLLYEDSYLANRYAGTDVFIDEIKNNGAIKATYVGGSKTHDLAVIKITESDRIANSYKNKTIDKATIADSSKDLAVGTECYAIGNPFGEGMSATQGIVSVAYEQILIEDVENSSSTGFAMRAVRVSCAINGGNSGGGLFNNKGELIGVINSKRYYASESDNTIAEGAGFAIPLTVVENVVNQIIAQCLNSTIKNTPTFLQLGITYTISDCVANYDTATGLITTTETVTVSDVTKYSYAERAGIKANDKLLSASVVYSNGKNVSKELNHYYTLSNLMLSVSRGDKMTISLARASEYLGEQILSVTITF